MNSCRSLDYAESIIYFTDLCKSIETYIYAKKKHLFASYPAAKHPNTANLRLHTYDKNQWTFLLTPHGRRLKLSEEFSKFGFFAKVSVPGKIYNSLVRPTGDGELYAVIVSSELSLPSYMVSRCYKKVAHSLTYLLKNPQTKFRVI